MPPSRGHVNRAEFCITACVYILSGCEMSIITYVHSVLAMCQALSIPSTLHISFKSSNSTLKETLLLLSLLTNEKPRGYTTVQCQTSIKPGLKALMLDLKVQRQVKVIICNLRSERA